MLIAKHIQRNRYDKMGVLCGYLTTLKRARDSAYDINQKNMTKKVYNWSCMFRVVDLFDSKFLLASFFNLKCPLLVKVQARPFPFYTPSHPRGPKLCPTQKVYRSTPHENIILAIALI